MDNRVKYNHDSAILVIHLLGKTLFGTKLFTFPFILFPTCPTSLIERQWYASEENCPPPPSFEGRAGLSLHGPLL